MYFSFKRITVEAPLMATSFVPAESPYIGSCLNLYNSNGQNNLSTTASFCNDWWKNLEWSWNLIRIARWLIAAIVFWLCSSFTTAVSKKKLSTILSANVANLTRFVTLTYWFKTFKILVYFISIYLLYMITSMGYSKHELSTINMSSPKNLSYYRGTQRRFPPKYVENTFCAVQSTFRSLEKHSKRR